MSFFDDEPTEAVPANSSPRSSGANRSPDQQSVVTRRLMAAGGAVLLLLIMIFAVKSCADSRTTTQLKEFNSKAAQLVADSDSQVGKAFFKEVQGASTKAPTTLQESVNQISVLAGEQVKQAQRLDPPDSLKTARDNLVLVMQLRYDGITAIARDLQTAVSRNSADSQRAVQSIAGNMRAFDASDAVYQWKVASAIAAALDSDGIAVGAGGVQVAKSSFLPSWQWLDPTYVAAQLGSTAGSAGTAGPGTHGHSLDTVSAGGQELAAGTENSIPGSPPPAFAVTFTNGGTADETNVQITIKVEGGPAPITVTKVVAQSKAGQQQTIQVPLGSAPPIGQSVTVTVTISTVPGESNGDNNTLTFPVTFT
ncbi:MAG: hypothetical protein WCI34_06200 [Actinomycetes bacterium]